MRYELEPRDARERRESTARAIREVRVGLEGLAKKLAGYGSVVTSNGPTPVEDREPRYAAVRRLCAEIREAIPRCTPTLSVEKANELKRTMDDIEDHVMPRVKKKVERLAQDPANLHRLSDPAWKNVFKAEGASLHHSASTLLRLAEEIGSLA
jgi:hypothetical protein